MKRLLIFIAVSCCVILGSAQIFAQAKERVRFAAGASSKSVKGVVRGYAYRDYIVGAREGQHIELKLTASAGSTVFSVFNPDGENLEGAAQQDWFSGTLPMTGDYVVRVAMMRSAARRKGSVSNFTLKISIE